MLKHNVQLVIPCRRFGKNCLSRNGASSMGAAPDEPPAPPMGNGLGEGFKDNQEAAEEGPPRKKCCPYDFDSSRCKIIDERVLCGYNRNAGRPQSKDAVKELSEGCRLRGGRLECGYQQEPYFNLRRPPAWDAAPADHEDRDADRHARGRGDDDDPIIESYPAHEKLIRQKKITSNSVKKPTAHCVEDGDRLICKPIV